jgi:uncharacterized membrane protein HdeD (DUF308 family)
MSTSTPSLADDLRKRATWSIFMGILTAALGLFLIAYPLATGAITTVLLGWVMIFVGIAEVVFALHSQTVGNFFLKVLLSALFGICGIALALFPISGVAALTALVGTILLVYGGVGIVSAFQLRPAEGWGWVLFDALATLAVGVLILAKWPSSSAWAIGTLVGVAVLMGGISRIMIAARMRKAVAVVDSKVRKAA